MIEYPFNKMIKEHVHVTLDVRVGAGLNMQDFLSRHLKTAQRRCGS